MRSRLTGRSDKDVAQICGQVAWVSSPSLFLHQYNEASTIFHGSFCECAAGNVVKEPSASPVHLPDWCQLVWYFSSPWQPMCLHSALFTHYFPLAHALKQQMSVK